MNVKFNLLICYALSSKNRNFGTKKIISPIVNFTNCPVAED